MTGQRLRRRRRALLDDDLREGLPPAPEVLDFPDLLEDAAYRARRSRGRTLFALATIGAWSTS